MPPTMIADRYHVLREIGRGGMGVVYQVLHKETGEQYALKVLLSHKTAKGDSVERFKREVKLPTHIKSEHVVQVTDSGELSGDTTDSGGPFYVMELLRGCDLRKLLDIQHPFTPPEILWILRQLALGLDQAHGVGIVHRDLKPDNIFLHCQEGGRMVVKILDFGIARYAQELLATGDREKLTATQAMLGTPLYMAPEQAKGGEGRAEIGPCTDVWAVGMIGFELLTGKTYWNADSLMAHLGQLLFSAMAPASSKAGELPAGFDAWFARSCSREIGGRYRSVGEQIGELARLLPVGAGAGEPPSALVRAVEGQMPPLVDHREATMISGVRMGSAELSLRAEIFPGHSVEQPLGSRRWPPLRSVLWVALGLSLVVLVLGLRLRGPQMSAPSPVARDGGGMAGGLPPVAGRGGTSAATAPTSTAERSAAQPSPEPKPASTPTAKASTPSRPRERTAKSRRTYVPPSL